MKFSKIAASIALAAIATVATVAFIAKKEVKRIKNDGKCFAVVELFTSEGCSSCPPADALVAKIQKENIDKPVYILAYHVDYWNRLGWKDVFSNAEFSKRQHEYVGFLHLNSVYTPQVVVNGKTEFVGSEEGALRNAIRAGLAKTVAAQLVLNISGLSQTRATVKYDIEGADKNTVLVLALLQRSAQTKVERGENGGRTLSHVQIVRTLQKVKLSQKVGQAALDLPHGFNPQGWEVIGLLQNTINGSVTAAAKAAFITQANAGSSAAVINSK